MSELKPCPFCGIMPIVMANRYRHNETTFCVKCNNLDCGVIPVTYESTDLEYVLEKWNQRMTETCHVGSCQPIGGTE